MQLETDKYLCDILDAINEIEAFVQGESFVAFLAQSLIQSAAERKVEIIGKALRRLQDTDEQIFAQIIDGQRIIKLWDVLVHSTEPMEAAMLWDIIKNHLPTLKNTVENLLSSS